MAEAYYEPIPATDGATLSPVPGAQFQVFEIADTTFSTPLSLRVGAGNPTTTVTASDTLATLPGVYVTSPNFEHIWKSGVFEWRRDSITGAKKAIEDAKIAASQSAADAAVSATLVKIHTVVGELTGDAVPTVQAAIDEVATAGGGTVALSPGHVYDINGTIFLKSNVTLDLNGGTLKAVANAAFVVHDMGVDSLIVGQDYNPASVKAVVAIAGTEASRLTNTRVINGTIDGNGINQPDDGSYANVLVDYADDARVDVTSLNARPGITINEPVGGANTGRRAFCLLVARARRTHVRGYYRNAGYDTIGLRQGAEETLLEGVSAFQAAKGAIQIATGALRTKIIGGLYDNTEGGTSASHAIFLHSAVWVDIVGATMRANTGSCFVAFGESSLFGPTQEVTMTSCAMEHTGASDMVSLPTQYTKKISLRNIIFRKSDAGALFIAQGASSQIYLDSWVGANTGASTAFPLTSLTDFQITNMDVETTAAGNQMFNMGSCQRGRITGKFKQSSGVAILGTSCTDITLEKVKITASDSVQFLGGNSNIDILDCDLTDVTNANKLRIYGADSGRIRGNKGAVTELNGTATIPAASTTVTVTHGLWQGTGTTATPRTDRLWSLGDFQVSLAGAPGNATGIRINTVTATTVNFAVLGAAPGVDLPIAWAARMDRTV